MTQTTHWLKEPRLVRDYIRKVKDANRAIINEGATYLALNYNRPAVNLSASDGAAIIGFDGLKDLGFNVLAEATRAGKAQVCQPLQPRVTPIGGTWEALRACESLGQVIDGVFDMCDFTGIMRALVADGACCGEGYGLVDVDPIRSDFFTERLDPLETFYNSDGTEVCTTQMMTKRKAIAWFGKKNEERIRLIENLPKYKPEHLVEVDTATQWDAEETICLYRTWAEPIGDQPGGYVIQVDDGEGTVLDHGKWLYPVPVFSFPWDHGHRGQNDAKPLGRTIAPMHYWLNELVRKMHDAARGSVPIVKGPRDPKLSDVPYQYVEEKQGERVEIFMPKTISSDIRQLIEDLRQQIYRETGLSEEAAAGAAPPQFKSGVALSTWRKIINESLNQQHRAYDRAHNKASRSICARAPDVYKSKPARGKARGTDVIEQIDFSKINLPEDSYSVAFEVVSDLPKHLPHQLEMVGFMEEKGWIDGDEVLSYINAVDFRAAAKRRGGPRALMNLQISKALNDADLIPPSEMQDNAKLAELAGQAYQAAQAQKVKPPRPNMQALLHLYLLAKARATQAAPAPAMPAPSLTPPVGQPAIAPAVSPDVTAPPAQPLPIV